MQPTISSGYLSLLCEVATREYGLAPARVQAVHGCDHEVLDDPGALVPNAAFHALLRFVLAETGDRALGLRLAHALDLRQQGFFGYALLSANTVRERIAVHERYQRLRGGVSFTLSVRDGMLAADCSTEGLPADLVPTVLDFGIAGACIYHRRRLQRAESGMQAWLSYREEPHHRAVRELVGGPVVFEAPCNRLEIPASDLDIPLVETPQLAKLAARQLDVKLGEVAATARDLLQQVRECVRRRLARDLSLEGIAAELGVSPRTLRRQLVARGTSYQTLLEEERRMRAAAYLAETDEEVAWIAAQLGYGDPSNFRRAFKRWTGQAPSAYRAAAGRGPRVAAAAGRN